MVVEISNWYDLDNVGNDLSGDYVLVNDLDSNTNGYAGIGDDFEPIGFIEDDEFTNEFKGSFDGDGFSISDLVIEYDNVTRGDIALFASTDTGALIENLSVDGSVTVTNSERFNYAGLVGNHDGGTIQNCVSHVDVTSDGERVGGLVGYHYLGTVTDSYATGSVDGGKHAGGLVGLNLGPVTESYATGSVEGDERVGGLAGRNQDTVTDSYATGSVEGDERVGGLVGENTETIQTSYAVGLVTGNTNVGALVGRNELNDELSDSYADEETTGQTDLTGDGLGSITNSETLTTAEMQGSEAETNMDGFDFANVWESLSTDYPILLIFAEEAYYNVSIDYTNSPVEVGDTLSVDYTVTNTGDVDDSQSITLDLSGIGQVDSETQSVSGGSSTSSTLSYTTLDDDEGERTATVDSDDDSDSIIVTLEALFAISALVNSESVEIQEIFAQINGEVKEISDVFAQVNGESRQV